MRNGMMLFVSDGSLNGDVIARPYLPGVVERG